jgi:hypothetical protein
MTVSLADMIAAAKSEKVFLKTFEQALATEQALCRSIGSFWVLVTATLV